MNANGTEEWVTFGSSVQVSSEEFTVDNNNNVLFTSFTELDETDERATDATELYSSPNSSIRSNESYTKRSVEASADDIQEKLPGIVERSKIAYSEISKGNSNLKKKTIIADSSTRNFIEKGKVASRVQNFGGGIKHSRESWHPKNNELHEMRSLKNSNATATVETNEEEEKDTDSDYGVQPEKYSKSFSAEDQTASMHTEDKEEVLETIDNFNFNDYSEWETEPAVKRSIVLSSDTVARAQKEPPPPPSEAITPRKSKSNRMKGKRDSMTPSKDQDDTEYSNAPSSTFADTPARSASAGGSITSDVVPGYGGVSVVKMPPAFSPSSIMSPRQVQFPELANRGENAVIEYQSFKDEIEPGIILNNPPTGYGSIQDKPEDAKKFSIQLPPRPDFWPLIETFHFMLGIALFISIIVWYDETISFCNGIQAEVDPKEEMSCYDRLTECNSSKSCQLRDKNGCQCEYDEHIDWPFWMMIGFFCLYFSYLIFLVRGACNSNRPQMRPLGRSFIILYGLEIGIFSSTVSAMSFADSSVTDWSDFLQLFFWLWLATRVLALVFGAYWRRDTFDLNLHEEEYAVYTETPKQEL